MGFHHYREAEKHVAESVKERNMPGKNMYNNKHYTVETSMARTPLGPFKLVRDKGSSSQ